jgi:poly(A) polymerase
MKSWKKFVSLFLAGLFAVTCAAADTVAVPESAGVGENGIFADELVRALVDDNHKIVEEEGWAELRIPVSLHHITEADMDPNAVDAAHKLIAGGYSAYIVGGAIRDLIMGVESNDFDIATDASNEEIERLLGDVTFHNVGEKVFAYAQYPDEIIDVATFYNIPVYFSGQSGIPEFDPGELMTDNPRNDSFRRDLTINSLYYDMSTGDLITWQGGLYDLKEGILETIADPRLELFDDPNVANRLLRFKARYGYRFSDRVEEAMRKNGAGYLRLISPSQWHSQIPRLFDRGFARESLEVLWDYEVFTVLFPALAAIEDREAMKAYEQTVMEELDQLYAAGGTISKSKILSMILLPGVEEAEKRMSREEAVAYVLGLQASIFEFRDNEYDETASALLYMTAAPGQTGAGFPFFTAEINKLVDENYLLVQQNGWAELRIPFSLHGIGRELFTPNSLDAAQKLMDAGYDAYLTGGAVRDAVMGLDANDCDIATNASNEEIERLLGDVTFHYADGKAFAYVHYPDEVVDVSTYYNIPAAYSGQSGIPDFNPESLTSDNPRDDSFRRDLTINGLYYDLSSGDLVDFHGGLRDIREGIIDTMTDADVSFADYPRIIRAVRFAARYGFRFSDRVETAIRERGAKYLATVNPSLGMSDAAKFYTGGYARKCLDLLEEYSLFTALYPSAAEMYETVEYKEYIHAAVDWMDEWISDGNLLNGNLSVAIFMWPALAGLSGEEQEAKAKDLIALQNGITEITEENKERFLAIFRLQEALTGDVTPEAAAEIVADPHFQEAYELLCIRSMTEAGLDRAVQDWTEQIDEAVGGEELAPAA